jgi:transglutaminase-like putative cysteine protease
MDTSLRSPLPRATLDGAARAALAPPPLRARWRSLPRDARDTLFLLAVIGWTVLPHAPNLPLWCLLFALGVLLWRARLALTNAPLPGRGWLIAALAVACALALWSHGTLIGRDPGVTLAVVLMALKTLELRARRDAFVVFFLGFFLVLTHFFFSQSIFTALAMIVSVWGLLAALALAHMPAGRPPLREALGQAARAALLGAPVVALLFVFFPRIGPLWGVPQEMTGKTGLSSTMTMGGIAEIAQDESVAMRLRFLDGTAPAPETLYFRGPVLDQFDGRTWRSGLRAMAALAPATAQRVSEAAAPLSYELTVEPLRLPMLPLLEFTPQAPTIDNDPGNLRLGLRSDGVWVARRPLVERLRVQAVAHPSPGRFGGSESAPPADLLQLPAGYNPRTLQWAADLRRQPHLAGADAHALARAVQAHIRKAGFRYTLAPGAYGETDARATIDEFWLDRRLGFCEHYAAAFVVVLRAMGVPARVVTGYQGTDPFPIDGYYVVRQSHAHAWAEYWHPQSGWVRADPTAVVAPERIARSRNLTPPRGVLMGALESVNPDLLAALRQWRELLDNRWNQWVLNYSRGQQLQLLERLGFDEPNWQNLLISLFVGASLLALLGALWAAWDRRRMDPWTLLLLRVRKAVATLEVDAPIHATPRRLADQLSQRHGKAARSLAEWLLRLEVERYGPDARRRPNDAWWREFRQRARALATLRRETPVASGG